MTNEWLKHEEGVTYKTANRSVLTTGQGYALHALVTVRSGSTSLAKVTLLYLCSCYYFSLK